MLKTHPLANASYTDQEILTFPYVNLSVAVATDYGLTSPVVRDADQMSLVELSRALREIVSGPGETAYRRRPAGWHLHPDQHGGLSGG